jgi:hypothetical protein
MRKIYVLAAIFAGMVFFIGGCGSDDPKDKNQNNSNNGGWEEPHNPSPQPNDGSLKLVARNVALLNAAQWSEEKDRWDGDTADVVNAYTYTGDFTYNGQEIIMPMSNGDTAIVNLVNYNGTEYEGMKMNPCVRNGIGATAALFAYIKQTYKTYNATFDDYCKGK